MTAPFLRPRRAPGAALVTLLALLSGPPSLATAQPLRPAPDAAPRGANPAAPPRPEPAPARPDPAFEAARLAFEALPEGERRGVQEALVWTGTFNGVLSGAFARRTYEAIVAHQRAAGAPPSGRLTDGERADLLAAGRRAREAAGFAPRTDPATGIGLGVPAKLLPRETRIPQGSRWQSADGRITLETRAFAPGETDLPATFDRVSAASPERKVTYKLKRPDFIVVTGETPTGRFYIRYADTPAGLRGFTLGYDKALAPSVDRVVIAIANSFEAQAAGAGPGASPPSVAAAPAGSAPSAAGRPALASPVAETRSVTALAVGPGRLLTAGLAACPAPRVGGVPARVVAQDAAAGLALLETAGAVTPAGLAEAPVPAPGTALVAVAMARGAAVVVPGEATAEGRVLAPLQPGAAGAPVLDREGRLVGLVAGYPGTPSRVAGIVPPLTLALVPAERVGAFLRAQGVARPAAAAPARSTGEIAARLAPALSALACD